MTGNEEFVEANRRLWNEWAPIHAASAFYDVEEFKRGGVRLRPYEVEEVGDVAGKDLLHVQCHFGLDTMSWTLSGLGVGYRVHVVPSKCAATVKSPSPAWACWPTAQTSFGARATMPRNTMAPGINVRVHAVPSQCMTRPLPT